MDAAAKPYHHGDLRAALLDEGMRLLDARSIDELSLREVARGVGVSATAVYRHFPDKSALLAALARLGLDRLAAAQHAASHAAGGGKAGFSATGLAYVEFALANPALFRLIFANPGPRPPVAMEGAANAEAPMTDALAFLLANAGEFAPAGVDARTYALQSWALAHGLAMLILDGRVTAGADVIRAAIDLRGVRE